MADVVRGITTVVSATRSPKLSQHVARNRCAEPSGEAEVHRPTYISRLMSVTPIHSPRSAKQRQPEFASTHPDPENRMAHLQQLMPQAEAFYQKYCTTGAAR